ncbi:MAG: ABC transporter ATP-binding protein [Bacteroidales bacterium]|nr:ABC transporter ATP-binding protein [Bacteroidales bacterium]
MKMNNEIVLLLESLIIGYEKGGHNIPVYLPVNASGRKGELIAVIGRNGIGKSTLLRSIAGLQKPLGGTVCINGKESREYSKTELAQNLGYVSTEVVKVNNMRVYDLVSLGRFPHTNWYGRMKQSDHDIVLNCLEMTGMTALADMLITEISDGERQKAMIARVLAQDAAVMVMDEPTAFLDITSRYEIVHLMHQLAVEKAGTIVFSTHDLNIALNQADKIWLMLDDDLKEGSPEDLMLEGSFDKLFSSPEVRFNTDDGSLTIKKEERGRLYVEGTGRLRHWTEKALSRAGFSITVEKTPRYIKTPPGKNGTWVLANGNSSREYNTIYDLLRELTA